MSNDKPQPAATAQPRPNGESRQPIQVRVVRFVLPMDALGLSVASSVTSKAAKTQPSKHEIQYLPWLRSFRLAYDPGQGQPVQVSMVPEAQVKSWDPMEQ